MSPETPSQGAERPIETVRGTYDWLPDDWTRLAGIEALMLDRFSRAGYEPLRTPVLEFTDLHERKSGAGIVSKLFEIGGIGAGQGGVCLRPELTAGIVRAYTSLPETPVLPWRVSHAGPVFRHETPRHDRLREFRQVGVERLGDSGPLADGEMIWLADWALAEAGVAGVTVRLGHVGLILEMLERSGLPGPLASALVEMLSEAATEGRNIEALESGLGQLEGWLGACDPDAIAVAADDGGIDRLFRTLVPVIVGRRSGHEIVHRLRRKWDLGHGLLQVLEGVRRQVHGLAGRKGPAREVLDGLQRDFQATAPESIAELRSLVEALEQYGVEAGRIELDLGSGRGIGFYSRMIFELIAPTPDGPVEVCGGGRYDGLARVLGSDRDDRGVGFAFGLERLGQVLDAQGRARPPRAQKGFIVVAESAMHAADAVRLSTYLRTKGAQVVLETDRALDVAIVMARGRGVTRVVAVTGRLETQGGLLLHDLAAGTVVEVVPATLARLARDEVEERRR
jgi:histidyl-tRNA synthetase